MSDESPEATETAMDFLRSEARVGLRFAEIAATETHDPIKRGHCRRIAETAYQTIVDRRSKTVLKPDEEAELNARMERLSQTIQAIPS